MVQAPAAVAVKELPRNAVFIQQLNFCDFFVFNSYSDNITFGNLPDGVARLAYIRKFAVNANKIVGFIAVGRHNFKNIDNIVVLI